jgi:hypothetical protein
MRRLTVLLALVALAGCHRGPSKQILGTWVPDTTGLPAADAPDAAALTRSTLVFRPNKSFAIGDKLEGSYTIAGRAVTLTTKKVLGRDANLIPGADTERIGELSEDGKHLTVTDPGSGASVAFVKG